MSAVHNTTSTVYINGQWKDKNGVANNTYSAKAIRDRSVYHTSNYFTAKKRQRKGVARIFIKPLAYNIRFRRWNYSSGYFQDVVKLTGNVQSEWRGYLRTPIEVPWYGDITFIDPSAAEKTAWMSVLNNRALAQIKGSRINLGQAFGERAQTVKLVQETVRRLVTSAKALRKGDLRAFAKGLGLDSETAGQSRNQWASSQQKKVGKSRYINGKKIAWKKFQRDFKQNPQDAFANAWLEFTYGWRPLLSDVYGAMAVFEKPIEEPMAYVRTRFSKQWVDVVTTSSMYFKTSTARSFSVRKQYILYYDYGDSATSPFVHSLASMGLTNPLELAWELLPFSFVVDWFLPIGSYLTALDATFGLKYRTGSYSDKWERRSDRTALGAGLPGGSLVYTRGESKDSFREEWFARYEQTSFPSPMLPSFKDPLGVSHALSALSLLNQVFNKKSK